MANKDWMNKTWRPAMGWMYMVVCVFDFILFPVLWTTAQLWEHHGVAGPIVQWNPLTLQGAGLFHMAMGVVLGLTAWGRTKEKISGYDTQMYDHNVEPQQPVYYRQPTQETYSRQYYRPTGYAGKKAPPPAYQPEI